MERNLPDFRDTLEWNLVARETYYAPEEPVEVSQRLPARTWQIQNSHVLIAGVTSRSARSTWHTGGWASAFLDFKPSSTSRFPASVQTASRRLRLGVTNLIVFPKLLDSWTLEVKFPYWLNDVSIEIWRYDGRDYAAYEQLDRLELKIDQL